MAAAAGISAHAARGVTVSLYYGQDTYSNSNNGVFITSGTYANAKATPLDTQGEVEHFAAATVTPVVVNPTGPTTITLPVGDYLSLAIDAVITGNPTTAPAGAGIPNLGLAGIGASFISSDVTGASLTPFTTGTPGSPDTTIGGLPAYASTAFVNASGQTITRGATTTSAFNGVAPNSAVLNPGIPAPGLSGVLASGEASPNLPGFDTAPNSSGSIGAGGGAGAFTTEAFNFAVAGGQPTGQQALSFASVNGTASYGTASDFADSVLFKGLTPGTVTLSPTVLAGSTAYWTVSKVTQTTTPSGSPSTKVTYGSNKLGAGDVVNNLPVLVINIPGVVATTHAILSYTAGPGSPVTGYGSQVATLTVTGSGGQYTVAQASITPTATGTVEAKTFSPASDEEIYALDVLVNGTQATAGQLAVLVTAINLGDANVTASSGVVATTSAPSPDPFASSYNLFIDPHGNADALLGIDLSSGNDALLQGYTFSAVAVVPEPMTLGLLALGGVGLMSRRHRRKV